MNGHAHAAGTPINGYGSSLDKHRIKWAVLLRLLHPGVGLKRWLLLGGFGISTASVGLAVLLRRMFALSLPDILPMYLEGVLLVMTGLGVLALAAYGMFRTVGPLIFRSSSLDSIANTIYARRSLGKGPKIVVIGGGTGLSVLLRGLKEYTDNITAIVTVGDDGGSSGRLREELGVLPPGDFRNCLVALSDAEPLVTELFQYRFDEGLGLKGHSFGNLFIVAMTNVTHSFEQALYESSRVLAVHGRIVPATSASLLLAAKLSNGELVLGESNITKRGSKIDRLFIDPEDAEAHPLALAAIAEAQFIVLGPGSLYTSVLPNLMVKGITRAVTQSSASKVYVCNVATERGETEGFTVSDHLAALQQHTDPYIVDNVLANDNPIELGPQFFGTPVTHDGTPIYPVTLNEADLTDSNHPVRHDSSKLAKAIMDVYDRGRNKTSRKVAVNHR